MELKTKFENKIGMDKMDLKLRIEIELKLNTYNEYWNFELNTDNNYYSKLHFTTIKIQISFISIYIYRIIF